jgi:hypothetical protein
MAENTKGKLTYKRRDFQGVDQYQVLHQGSIVGRITPKGVHVEKVFACEYYDRHGEGMIVFHETKKSLASAKAWMLQQFQAVRQVTV